VSDMRRLSGRIRVRASRADVGASVRRSPRRVAGLADGRACGDRSGGELLLVHTAGAKGDWRIAGADVGVFDTDLAAVAARAAERQLGPAPDADEKGAVDMQCAPAAGCVGVRGGGLANCSRW